MAISATAVPNGDPNQLLKSDEEPACFWITHPNNDVRYNVASGCDFGFWYALPANPTGDHLGYNKNSLFLFLFLFFISNIPKYLE